MWRRDLEEMGDGEPKPHKTQSTAEVISIENLSSVPAHLREASVPAAGGGMRLNSKP
jgi:hypothetical protein